MTATTTRHASPTAAPRTGWGKSALPHPDQRTKTQLPFAALPHELRKDPKLKGHNLAIVLAAALCEYARGYKVSCYPTNATLAEDLGCAQSTIRAALAVLKASGWIKVVIGANQPNGRRIYLTWRLDHTTSPRQVSDTCQPAGTHRRPVGPTRPRASTKEEIVIEEGIEEESRQFARAIERPRGEEPAPLARPAIPETQAGPCPKAAPPPASEARAAPVAGTLVSPAHSGAPQDCSSLLEPDTPLVQVAEHGTVPHPISPVSRPAAPGLEAARPAHQGSPAGSPPKAAPEPAPSPTAAGPALPLTPEQQARLEALPAATRDLVLTWLLTGDRILVAEAKKKLVPPRPRPEAPKTLPEVLGRIREDPSFPSLAADWLSSALQDRKSYSGFKARCEEAWRGELAVDRLVSAYDQAMGPKARNPGAIFQSVLKRRE